MRYLVQRKLPGLQGDNGCWADIAWVDAQTDDAAAEMGARDMGEQWEGAVLRAVPVADAGLPREFRIEVTVTRTATVGAVPVDD